MANLSEFELHQMMAAMEAIERRFDVVVLDCGAGISRNVVTFAGAADTALVVATPEPTAVADAYAMIKALSQAPVDADRLAVSIGTIVNLAESRREGRETYDRLASVAARFLHLPVTDYGYILRDDHVPAAVRERAPVVLRYPRSSSSSCLMASAARLHRELGCTVQRQGLFYRVMNLFL
jgi:flagellar biosynthesis protein FlhG